MRIFAGTDKRNGLFPLNVHDFYIVPARNIGINSIPSKGHVVCISINLEGLGANNSDILRFAVGRPHRFSIRCTIMPWDQLSNINTPNAERAHR